MYNPLYLSQPNMVQVKTEERIDQFIEQLLASEILSDDLDNSEELRHLIKRMLEIQDEDTRKACADSVIGSEEAYYACMNVVAV